MKKIILGVILVGCSTIISAAEFDDMVQRYVEHATKQISGKSITVSGQVVDEQGNALDDVTIYAELSTNIPYDSKPSQRQDIHSESGSFSLHVADWGGVTLFFKKDGYYPLESKPYTLNYGTTEAERNRGVRKSTEYPNETIVMKATGSLPKTASMRMTWDVAEDQLASTGLDFLTFHLRRGDNLDGCLEVKFEKRSRETAHETFGLQSLRFHAANGEGVIRVEKAKSLRDLQEAPPTGYLSQIFLVRDLLGKDVYFYFFYNKVFGKMKIQVRAINPNGQLQLQITTVVNRESNPDLQRQLGSLDE